MHDADLTQKLYFAESDFLTALRGGTTMVASYHRTWSTLLDVLRTESNSGCIGHETLSLAHSVASRIANLASCFLDIQRGEELYTASFRQDSDVLLHQMAALDINPNQKSSQSVIRDDILSPTCSSTPVQNAETSSARFLAPAYRWLLDNLHNPYPSAEVKAQMAAISTCHISSINSWFTNARRRIGWTTLCRERFANCRADMIKAAYRALVDEDPQHPLAPDLSHAFVEMKVAAEGLYASTFTRSTFAGDLDAIVKDGMVKDSEFIPLAGRSNSAKRARDSYPSPDRSIAASPTSSLDLSLIDENEEEFVAPLILAGSKRCRSDVEPVETRSPERPIKRLRASTASHTHLPSPPSSTDGIDALSEGGSPELHSVHPTQSDATVALPSRKRPLSDANTGNIPKRPRDSAVAPPLHTAPDPLPSCNMENEYSIDDWFNTNLDALFNIPPPVDATAPDFATPWEVEMFKDYNIPGHSNSTPTAAGTHSFVPTNLSDFDDLLQSIGDNAFVTPSESVLPSDLTAHTSLLDSSIPDFSQTDLDWTSLLDPDAYQPTDYSTFPQYPTDSQPLSEIELSMLQLPPATNSQEDAASKQAKLEQYHAMQEAVRQMEKELLSEGIVI